ncbi:hypothetical protein IQ22_04229 [Pseudomonas duriflava]|uniref:Uncharacterized protein n=1 Tax=Pseudomonas duriflava TaxID=459528 RepID=A0A562PVA8_9PSED|nr:hypothetical protein [Pseudomonas duriflava]TWI48036.1 hypothetical protein IQ22_04229 [Pseudomonas duriflava]
MNFTEQLQTALAKREQEAKAILDRLVAKTTYVGRQIAVSALLFAFKRGEISEHVFDQYWQRLGGEGLRGAA